ncbi:MAG: acyl carrier protein [Blautia sp.]
MIVEEAKKEIFRVIMESTETELEVTEETGLVKDMGLSSVEVFVLLGDLEDAFGIRIPASELSQVRTAGDLCQLIISILKEKK